MSTQIDEKKRKLNELLEQAKAKGVMTYDEILKKLDINENDPEQFDTVLEMLGDMSVETVLYTESDNALPSEQLLDVLDTLTPREEKALRLRFGLDDGNPRTLEEISRELKVTTERIRQIESRSLRRLIHPTGSTRAEVESSALKELLMLSSELVRFKRAVH